MRLPTCTLHNTDCVTGMAERLEPNSVDLVVTSIPFEELFQYSSRIEDVGNNGQTVAVRDGRFALNLRFMIKQLYRVLKPGCNACIHIQQLLAFKNTHGFIGRRDFRGAVVDLFGAGGFDGKFSDPTDDTKFNFFGEFAIAKDPQLMAMRLNLHSLQFKTGHSRSSVDLCPCPNDYVMIFKKPGECPHRVRALKHEKNPKGWVTQEEWIRDACGIWTDIRMTDVLDVSHSKDEEMEKHVCPLQFQVIRRLVRLYTNPISIQPDVTVLDPFMGIGSTAAVCLGCGTQDGRIEEPRNVVGFELKDTYYKNSLVYTGRAMVALKAQLAGGNDGMLPFDEPSEVAEVLA